MRPTRFLISATQTVEESKRELCLNEYARFKTLLDGSASPHHFICLSVFLRIYRSLALFLSSLSWENSRSGNLKEKNISLPDWTHRWVLGRGCLVYTHASVGTLFQFHIQIFFTWENMYSLMKAGRISHTCVCKSVRLIHIHVSLHMTVTWSQSNIYFLSRSFSYSLFHRLIRINVQRAEWMNAVWANATHDRKHLLHHSIQLLILNPLYSKTGNWHKRSKVWG